MNESKLLLIGINSKFIHSNLAIYSLKACCSDYSNHIVIKEYTINRPMQEILADIYEEKPRMIAFSCYIWNIRLVYDLITELVKILPDTDIWLGGPEVSFDCFDILNSHKEIRGIMSGEGEITYALLAKSYVEYVDDAAMLLRALNSIGGLYINGPKPVFTGERTCMNMDELAFAYEDLSQFENRIIYYETSRGCPFSCSYCLSSVEKKLRFKSLAKVYKELTQFIDAKVKQVKFVDRTFNCSHEHAIGIWKFIKENDNGVTNFHFEISADLLNDEELSILTSMRPGLVQLEIGVQSVNDETIAAINRTMNLEKLANAVSILRKANNVHLHLDLIAGLPYEDRESFINSFNVVYSMNPEQLQLGFLKVLKGTEMECMANDFAVRRMSIPPYEVLSTKWLSYEDICELKAVEEMVELYYNSNQYRHILTYLEQAFASPYEMFRKLATFYSERGYTVMTPSRLYRYDVLLEFANVSDPGKEELYCELFTFDMYLRENLKSRPSFAREYPKMKDIMKNYKKTSEYHYELFSYPVWDENVEDMQALSEDMLVRFDYRERSPLTNDAVIKLMFCKD